jgi:hypothetical protein
MEAKEKVYRKGEIGKEFSASDMIAAVIENQIRCSFKKGQLMRTKTSGTRKWMIFVT